MRLLFVLALVFVALPGVLRFSSHGDVFIGSEPYYHAVSNAWTPFQVLAGFVKPVLGVWTFFILPAVFALLSFVLFWLLLRRLGCGFTRWPLLLFSVSPSLLTASALFLPYSFVLSVLLLGLVLLTFDDYRLWLSVPLFLLVGLSGLVSAIAGFFLVMCLLLFKKRWFGSRLAVVVPFFLVLFFRPPFIREPAGLPSWISDLGGVYGLSFFSIVLFLVGVSLLWKYKSKYYGLFAACFVFVLISALIPQLLLFLNVIVSYVGGFALFRLASYSWDLRFLRKISLIVLFFGLLLGGLFHASLLSEMEPSPGFFKVLKVPPGVVLTHESYGFWVEYAGHTPVLSPFDNDRDIGDEIWMTSDLGRAKSLLHDLNVSYVLVSDQMEHGLVWQRPGLGLDFLLTNNETFKKINLSSGFGVWMVR